MASTWSGLDERFSSAMCLEAVGLGGPWREMGRT